MRLPEISLMMSTHPLLNPPQLLVSWPNDSASPCIPLHHPHSSRRSWVLWGSLPSWNNDQQRQALQTVHRLHTLSMAVPERLHWVLAASLAEPAANFHYAFHLHQVCSNRQYDILEYIMYIYINDVCLHTTACSGVWSDLPSCLQSLEKFEMFTSPGLAQCMIHGQTGSRVLLGGHASTKPQDDLQHSLSLKHENCKLLPISSLQVSFRNIFWDLQKEADLWTGISLLLVDQRFRSRRPETKRQTTAMAWKLENHFK